MVVEAAADDAAVAAVDDAAPEVALPEEGLHAAMPSTAMLHIATTAPRRDGREN